MGFEAKCVVVCDTVDEFANRVERGVFDLVFCRVAADCPKDADKETSMVAVDNYWRGVSGAVELVKDGGYVCVDNILHVDDIRTGLYFNRKMMIYGGVCCVAKVVLGRCDRGRVSKRGLVTIFRKLTKDEIVYIQNSMHELSVMNEEEREFDKRWRKYSDVYMRVHNNSSLVGNKPLPFVDMYSDSPFGLCTFYGDIVRCFSNTDDIVIDLSMGGMVLAERCIDMGRGVCVVSPNRDTVDMIKDGFKDKCIELLRYPREKGDVAAGCYDVKSNFYNVKTRIRKKGERTGSEVIEDSVSTYGLGWKPERVERRAYQTDFSDIPF